MLIVPEDPTVNGHILKPLVERMLTECGRTNARIDVLSNPKVQGYEHAKHNLPTIVTRYQYLDLILFLVDADGKDRSSEFARLEELSPRLICAAAVQEIETWLLAGYAERLAISWREVRENISVKEEVFEPFLKQYGDPRRYGGGRDLLMKQTLANYEGLLQRCPELKSLHQRVCASFDSLPGLS